LVNEVDEVGAGEGRLAVVEGVGANGLEYMTGGRAVILGPGVEAPSSTAATSDGNRFA